MRSIRVLIALLAMFFAWQIVSAALLVPGIYVCANLLAISANKNSFTCYLADACYREPMQVANLPINYPISNVVPHTSARLINRLPQTVHS